MPRPTTAIFRNDLLPGCITLQEPSQVAVDHWLLGHFDDIVWRHLPNFQSRRVRDGVVRRMIGKRPNAAALESCAERHPDRGAPQGGVGTPPEQEVILESGSPSCRMGAQFVG